jgi:hypothetical protein
MGARVIGAVAYCVGLGRVEITDQAGPRVGDWSGSKRAGGLARWKNSIGPRRARIRPKVSFSPFFLFFIVSIFFSYFNFKSNQVLNSKFQIYAQEKLHMMHNYYIVFFYLFYYYIN